MSSANKNIPVVQISEPPMLERASPKSEHRRWKSDPNRTRAMENVFSYEYKFEDGKLAGLAEYHPDEDYMHYISSRSTSRTVSRNQSSRTSREDMLAPSSLDDRKSSSSSQGSQTTQGQPSSPRKTGVMKRALSLHSLTRRTSSDEKRKSPKSPKSPRSPPSPYSRPEIEQLAASFGPKGPQHITGPLQALPEIRSDNMFESPRSAPLPPSRNPSRLIGRPELQREFRGKGFGPIQRKDSSHDAFLPPTKFSAPQGRQEKDQPTSPTTPDLAQKPGSIKPSMSRPAPIRRKTSKFIEHIETKEKPQSGLPLAKAAVEEIPPVPPMVLLPLDFDVPVSEVTFSAPKWAETEPQPQIPMRRFSTVTLAPVSPMPDAAMLRRNTDLAPSIATMKAISPKSDTGVWQPSSTLKRSSSTMKALPPAPGQLPKRSASTRTRPAPIMGGVCMAEMKAVLASPIVAQGHARMISC